jgi:hypothetical protein
MSSKLSFLDLTELEIDEFNDENRVNYPKIE